MLIIQISITVLFGLSTFVLVTNCCSSQLTRSFKWDYISCNGRNDNVIIETIGPVDKNPKNKTEMKSKNISTNFSPNPKLDKINTKHIINLRKQDERDKFVRKTKVRKCPHYFDLLFCLNGGRCFNYIIGESSIISCECPEGYYGERCDFKYSSYDVAVISKCDPDLDLVFCLNGGRCFNYVIQGAPVISCLCMEGYFGERCDSKYTIQEDSVSYGYYDFNNHYNGYIIRKAKIYATPFIAALIIFLFLIVFTIFLDSIRQACKSKFYCYRSSN